MRSYGANEALRVGVGIPEAVYAADRRIVSLWGQDQGRSTRPPPEKLGGEGHDPLISIVWSPVGAIVADMLLDKSPEGGDLGTEFPVYQVAPVTPENP